MILDFRPILARSLIVASDSGTESRPVCLEIGLPEGGDPSQTGEGKAAFRIRPLTGWINVFGVDPMQAVALAIQLGERKAENLGADWTDPD